MGRFSGQRLALWSLLLIGLILLAMVADCESAKKKKSTKKAKKEAEQPKEADAKAKSDDDDDDDDKDKGKAKKPWNKMTKADWDRLEREAEGPGEPWKPPDTGNIEFDPKNPMAYVKASKKGKPAMMFASVSKIKDAKTGEMRERTKDETEEVAFKHKNLMQSGHLDATPYVIDPGKILWTVHDGSRGYEVKSFLMRQEEVVEFEWDQQKATKDSWKPKEDVEEEF